MKTVIGLVTAVLVVAVLLAFYLSGPSRKMSTQRCTPQQMGRDIRAYIAFCAPTKHGVGEWQYVQRTNAWERFKGAITGSP
jgi:hypothetical protein